MTSFYFEDIFERYAAEIDDLRSDSEGKDVLQRRVRDKHKEFSFLLSMIDAALAKAGGESFLVTTAVLEYLLGSGLSARSAPEASADEEEDEGADDLGESGEDWMSEQGFDAIDR